MVNPLTPTRPQIARMVGNDPEMIRAFETLFRVVGIDNAADFDEVTAEVVAAQLEAIRALPRPAANSGIVDYIDFRASAPHAEAERRLCWNDDDDTLNIGMMYGVSQQVGLEAYARVENNTGVTIPNGAVVGFSGGGTGGAISVSPFIADGSDPSVYILGVMTHDLPDMSSRGYCTQMGFVRGIDTSAFAVGDPIYASDSIAGGMTNIKPTAPNNVILVGICLTSSADNGVIFVRPTIEVQKYYGQFSATVSQSPAVADTAYPVEFDSTEVALGVSISGTASQIIAANSGLYNFALTFQIVSGSASKKDIWFWYRKNGVDVPNSSFLATVSESGALLALSRAEFFSLQAGDYMEIMWASDSTDVTISAEAATSFAPASPACTLAVTQIQQ